MSISSFHIIVVSQGPKVGLPIYRQQLHERTRANTQSAGQTMQNGDNYFKDGQQMVKILVKVTDMHLKLIIISCYSCFGLRVHDTDTSFGLVVRLSHL